VHQIKYLAPIASFALTNDFSHLAVGLSDGTFSISVNKSKIVKEEKVMEEGLELNLERGSETLSYKYFFRGIYAKNTNNDVTRIETIKAAKLKDYDNMLKKFRYGDALTRVLSTYDTQTIIAVIEELLHRGGLETALKNLDTNSMKMLLEFILKKCDSSNHQQMILVVLERAIAYLGNLEKYEAILIDSLLTKISEKLAIEEDMVLQASELGGMIETIEALSG